MRFSKKFLVFFLFCLMMSNGYSANTICTRKKQINTQEKKIEDFSKNSKNSKNSKSSESKVIEIGDDAKLDNYIKISLQNNPGLKSAFYEWKASFSKISQTFSLPDPQFAYTDYIEDTQKKTYSINQKFPFPDKLWIRKSKAFKASEEVFYNFHKQQLDLITKITDTYYEYAYLSKAVLLMKENIKLLMNFESVAQAKYKSGLVQNHDLLKVQVELGKLENELLSLENLRFPLIARLNALLNLPKDNILPWPEEKLEDIGLDHEYEEIINLYDELIKNNPDILSLIERVEKNKNALKLAKRDYVPDIAVGITTDPLMPNTVEMVMLSVNIPIWFKRLNAGVQEAEATLKATESMLENKKNDLLSQLTFVHYKLHDSLRQSCLYKDALLPKAIQSLNASQTGYESGKTDFLSLIDAERALLNFQLAYYRQNTNFYQRLAELKNLLGELYDE